MLLKHIELANFRNYSELSLDFNKRRVIFIGENAQGKTNLLEAISILSWGRSPFGSKDEELVNFDSQQAIIRSIVEREVGPMSVDLLFQRSGRRSIKVNGLFQKKLSDLLGKVLVVLFTCQDIQMIKGSPAGRRDFLDSILMKLSSSYYPLIHQYEKVLAQRNHALRQLQEGLGGVDLEVWNIQLVTLAKEVNKRRREFLKEFEPIAQKWQSSLSEGKEDLVIHLESSFNDDEDYLAQLESCRPKEIARGASMLGPHRDDLTVMLNGHEAKSYASQGQQRSIVLSLKLAELEIMTKRTGESPILLLDDVLAELDVKRQNRLLESIEDGVQAFVTTTHLSDFSAGWIEGAQILSVRQGKVVPL